MAANVGTDPTLDFLARLNDPSQWVIRKNVPVIKPHKNAIHTDDGKVIPYEVTAGDMSSVAGEMLAREKASGVVATLGPGHRNLAKNAKETEQPPIYGFLRNPRAGTFGPQGTPCVLVDEYLKPECASLAADYPHRSSEYQPFKKLVSYVALLKREPALDMGIVCYSKREPTVYLESEGMDDETPEVETQNQDQAAGADDAADDALIQRLAKRHPWVKYAMACYEASQAAASTPNAGNVSNPAEVEPDDKNKEVARMQKEDKAVSLANQNATIAKLQSDLAIANGKLEVLSKDRELRVCEQIVMQLQQEGYQLVRADEVQEMLPLNPEQREKRCAWIRKHLVAVPAAQGFIQTYQGAVEGPTKQLPVTAEMAGKAAKWAGDDEAKYEQAIAKLQAGETLN